MGIRVFFYFAIVNMIFSILAGCLAIQFTYVNAIDKLFSVPILIELPQSLSTIDIRMVGFWAFIGLLFGTWSWFIFNKLLNDLFERFGNPRSVPDEAIQYTNARHIKKVTMISAVIWLLIGLAIVFLLKDPDGFTKYNNYLIIGGYLVTGGLCSIIAHISLMIIGSIVHF